MDGMKHKLLMDDITVVVDTREQYPYEFEMPTVVDGLVTGDYSLLGFERWVAFERKSLPDFIACCGKGRDRFQRELDRMRGYPFHAVIIEATWRDLKEGMWQSRIRPHAVVQTFLSWQSQGHSLTLAGGREMGQRCMSEMLRLTANKLYQGTRGMTGVKTSRRERQVCHQP